jgi:hypothetical protein
VIEYPIDDPLAAVRVAAALTDGLSRLGFSVSTSSSIEGLNDCKKVVRNKSVTPLFDGDVAGLTRGRMMWLALKARNGNVVGLQAFRHDYVDTSLGDWAPSYIIGLYMRLKELMVPTFSSASEKTVADTLRGRLVYHGELWIDSQVKNRKVMDAFTRLGLVLSVIKWNPDAIWALTAEKMALHGHPTRMGYSTVEGGFLRWEWAPDDNPMVEWLLVAERKALGQIVQEMMVEPVLPLAELGSEPLKIGWPTAMEELFAIR